MAHNGSIRVYEVATRADYYLIDEQTGARISNLRHLDVHAFILAATSQPPRREIPAGTLIRVLTDGLGTTVNRLAETASVVEVTEKPTAGSPDFLASSIRFLQPAYGRILHGSSTPGDRIYVDGGFIALPPNTIAVDLYDEVNGYQLPAWSIIRIVSIPGTEQQNGQLVETAGLVEVTEVVQ